MITIQIPSNFISERTYIIDILFGEFLGLEYQIKVGNERKEYVIQIENSSKLVIEDHFFSNFRDGLSYLDGKNIPTSVGFYKNLFLGSDNIPIIFGNDRLKINSDCIVCGNDIFASSFFMLARWEEYVCKAKDKHNRFSAYSSLAYRNNFLDRPIVNEYIETLWNMLVYLGIKQKRKERKFELILTHDVDTLRLWENIGAFIRTIGGDIISLRSPRCTVNNIKSYLLNKMGLQSDPYNTFDYLMDLSERINVKSHFFFMTGGVTNHDKKYNVKEDYVKLLMKRIHQRGHIIGLHPSYNTYNNPQLWYEEYKRLFEVSPQSIYAGRQHFLRFEIPITWQIWEDNKMEWDSTLSFVDKEGFRGGVCYPYSVFNILSRKRLNLKERPLIVMEGSFVQYQNVSSDYMKNKICNLINTVKRYNGEFVFLWHNSSFNVPEWEGYQEIYPEILFQFQN